MGEQMPNDDPLDLPRGMTRLFIGLLKKGPTWSTETIPQIRSGKKMKGPGCLDSIYRTYHAEMLFPLFPEILSGLYLFRKLPITGS